MIHSVIFKNDAVGDLIHSLAAINNLTKSNEVQKITLFLSKLNQNFSFLVKNPKINIKIINYNMTISEKIKLIFFLKKNNVSNVYILAPKKFYFFLPLIFRKIKFYAICINNVNNYKRPGLFLRKFLYKFEINHRENIFKRDSAQLIQNRLTSDNNSNFNLSINSKKTDELTNLLPKNYLYFHYKKKIFDELNWNFSKLQNLFSEFKKYFNNIVFTKDISGWREENITDENSNIFKKNFSSYDFNSKKFTDKKTDILFLDNIEGEDLFNVIKYSNKVVAFHGMMTNLAWLLEKPVLDLFHCKIDKWDDYRRYRNSFYEFKPKHKNYDFTIPKKNIVKTINKIKFSFNK